MFKFAIICSSSSSKTVGPMRAPAFLRNTARFDYQVCLFKNAIIIIGNKKVIYCKTTLTNIYTNILLLPYLKDINRDFVRSYFTILLYGI